MPRVGDVVQFTLAQVNQRVTGEADFNRLPELLKEVISTSGAPDIQWTKNNPNIEGVKVNSDGANRELVLGWQFEIIEFFYKTANLDSYSGECEILITNDTTRDGGIELTIMPTGPVTPTVV